MGSHMIRHQLILTSGEEKEVTPLRVQQRDQSAWGIEFIWHLKDGMHKVWIPFSQIASWDYQEVWETHIVRPLSQGLYPFTKPILCVTVDTRDTIVEITVIQPAS